MCICEFIIACVYSLHFGTMLGQVRRRLDFTHWTLHTYLHVLEVMQIVVLLPMHWCIGA